MQSRAARRAAAEQRAAEERAFWDSTAAAAMGAMAGAPGKHSVNGKPANDIVDLALLVAGIADAALAERRRRFRGG